MHNTPDGLKNPSGVSYQKSGPVIVGTGVLDGPLSNDYIITNQDTPDRLKIRRGYFYKFVHPNRGVEK